MADNGCVLIGQGGITGELAARLGGVMAPAPAPADARLHVLVDWHNAVHLRGLVALLGSRAWVLVERTAAGAVVGPRFGPGLPCFNCYLRRLASNGHGLPGPVRDGTLVPRIEQALRTLAESRPAASSTQLGISPKTSRQTHRLFAVPGCGCAQRAADGSGRLGLESVVSDRIGIVRSVEVREDDRWGVATAVASGCRTDALQLLPAVVGGSGCSDRPEEARAAAIAEAVERYCARFLLQETLVAGRQSLDGPSLSPDPWRFGDHPISPETRLRWVRGRSLVDGRPLYVPAVSVYLLYPCADSEPPVSKTSSEGLAAGPHLDAAVARATLEAVERDAFMRAWRFDLPVARVRDRPIGVAGLHLTMVPNPFDVPVVAAFLEQDAVPYSAAGLAARMCLDEAARAASLEAIAERLAWERILSREAAAEAHPADQPSYHRFVHATDYRLRRARTRWLRAAPAVPDHDQRSWPSVVSRLPQAAFVDLTTPDVASTGCRVARVVVEGFVGIDPDATRSRLGGNATPHPMS